LAVITLFYMGLLGPVQVISPYPGPPTKFYLTLQYLSIGRHFKTGMYPKSNILYTLSHMLTRDALMCEEERPVARGYKFSSHIALQKV
jgi:hypothetical protein